MPKVTVEGAQEIYADGTYFPDNLGIYIYINTLFLWNKWDIIKLGRLKNTRESKFGCRKK